MTEKLTPQQEKFCQEVVKGKSLSDAYRAAYKVGKMTPKSINECASQLRKDPKITSRINELAQKVEGEVVVETSKILREALRLAQSNIANIIDPLTGRVKLPHELDADTAAAVASFKIDEFGRIEYKFWDKNSAIERLFKHKGLFKQDNEQKNDPITALMKAVTGGVLKPGAVFKPGQITQDDQDNE